MDKTLNKVVLLEYVFSLLLLIGTVLCIYTPELFWFKRGANFTVQIMLGILVIALLSFIFNRRRVVFTALACCALLCMHLKNSSNGHLRLAVKTEQPEVKLGHINLSLAEEYEATLQTIRSTDLDVWSFQELTPDWHQFLQSALCEEYPYEASLVRIDPYGLAIWSKYPVVFADTFFYEDIPNLRVSIEPEVDRYFHIISSHTTAPVNANAYQKIRLHFRLVSRYISTLDGPVITCGDYNLPSWAPEVKEYKNLAQLSDSRRDINPASLQGSFTLFKVPVDHIFYTEGVECTEFRVIDDLRSRHLGIIGTYQLKEINL